MNSNRVRKIEFSGLPGSGKTTICRELVREYRLFDPIRLQEQLFANIPLPEAIALMLPRVARKLREKALARTIRQVISKMHNTRPELVDTVTQAIEDREQLSPEIKEKLIYWTLRSQALSEIADDMLTDPDIFVDDEGSVHRATMLYAGVCASGASKRLLNQKIYDYLEYTPPVDLFIVVDAPNSLCIERMKAREKGLPTRLKLSSYAQIEEFLDASREVAQVAARYLSRRGVPVLYVNTAERSRWESVEKIEQAGFFDTQPLSQSA